jgi:OOP family OmpA-OmpF porin
LIGDDPAGEKMLKQMTKKDVCGFAVRADSFTFKIDMGKFVEEIFLVIGPDADRDRVFDIFDECPNTPRGVQVDDVGCPFDSDKDGIYDYLDKCPNTAKGIKVDQTGCPYDLDGDGVPDYKDNCPDTPKGVKVVDTGCPPDTDGDGVYDYKDKCPGTPEGAKVDAAGCWVLKGVKFDTGKAVVKTKYYPILDEIAAILKKNRGIKVEVQGHTDSRGSEKYNQKLSEARAKMVMAYLVKAGIEQNRLIYEGYGESKPIASNKTTKGRTENRRVNLNRIR